MTPLIMHVVPGTGSDEGRAAAPIGAAALPSCLCGDQDAVALPSSAAPAAVSTGGDVGQFRLRACRGR